MLATWKKSNDKSRQSIKKQRHHFAFKGLYGQSYGFSSSHVWMWELDNKKGWVLKNWCLQIMVLEKTLESPLDSKNMKPLIPKEINPEYSLEGLMLKLKLQYFGHLMQTRDWERPWCWERWRAKGEAGRQRMRWLDSITDSMHMNFINLWEIIEDSRAWRAVVHGGSKEWDMT